MNIPQFRCTIIRGKAKKSLDDLLPRYAKIINDICPCSKENFIELFNKSFRTSEDDVEKTLNNHRTEIAGKLFGMYYFDNNKMVYTSERTLKFLKDEDQPSFFKDICSKFQFPNGMDDGKNIIEKLEKKLSIKQFPFLLELLFIANNENIYLTKDEVGYFVLNNLSVLQGKETPQNIYEYILESRKNGVQVKVRVDGNNYAYDLQHINEQIVLLELANLIRVTDKSLVLNSEELEAISYMRSQWNTPLKFDIYNYSNDVAGRKSLRADWQLYYSKVNKESIDIFITSLDAIKFNIKDKSKDTEKSINKQSNKELGDEGEEFIFSFEKERVSLYDSRLTNKVLLLGQTRGLGYDIQSIIADGSDKSEFVQYIEVKATKRVTLPEVKNDGWLDVIGVTRNEWVAAEQHGKFFSFYRVYFTPNETVIHVIRDPYRKSQEKTLKCTPVNYRIDFSIESIDDTLRVLGE